MGQTFVNIFIYPGGAEDLELQSRITSARNQDLRIQNTRTIESIPFYVPTRLQNHKFDLIRCGRQDWQGPRDSYKLRLESFGFGLLVASCQLLVQNIVVKLRSTKILPRKGTVWPIFWYFRIPMPVTSPFLNFVNFFSFTLPHLIFSFWCHSNFNGGV